MMALLDNTAYNNGKCKDMSKDTKDGKDCKDDTMPFAFLVHQPHRHHHAVWIQQHVKKTTCDDK